MLRGKLQQEGSSRLISLEVILPLHTDIFVKRDSQVHLAYTADFSSLTPPLLVSSCLTVPLSAPHKSKMTPISTDRPVGSICLVAVNFSQLSLYLLSSTIRLPCKIQLAPC